MRRFFWCILAAAVLLFVYHTSRASGSEPELEPIQMQMQKMPILVVELHSGGQGKRLSVSYLGDLPDSISVVLSGTTETKRVYLGRPDPAAVTR